MERKTFTNPKVDLDVTIELDNGEKLELTCTNRFVYSTIKPIMQEAINLSEAESDTIASFESVIRVLSLVYDKEQDYLEENLAPSTIIEIYKYISSKIMKFEKKS